MTRWFSVLAPLALAGLLAPGPGCSGVQEQEEAKARLFNRINFLFVQFNDAWVEPNEARQASVRAELVRLVGQRFDEVAAGLSSEDKSQQVFAAFALGFSRNRAAVGLLEGAVRSPVPAVRANAAAALGMLGFEDISERPFADLLKDPEPVVRQGALVGLCLLLGENRDRGLLGAIHEKLQDPVMDVRNDALILLRKLKRKESVPVILERPVKDADPLVRANAAATLGAMGPNALEATPALIEMLRDDVPKVVESAWVALKAVHQKDFDRSYGSWRGWYEDELQHHYTCLEHKDVSLPVPGECPTCKVKLERLPRDSGKKSQAPAGPFTCPDHPEVLTSTPGKCGRTHCGKELVPQKPESLLYACPEHPDILTTTPARCGKPGCGKDLVRRDPHPTYYVCPLHTEVLTTTPAKCGKPGCGKELVPKN